MTSNVGDVWRQVHHALQAFVSRRVADPAAAGDILQEVYLRMHRGIKDLKDPGRLLPWVYQITRHVIVDFYRSPERRREMPSGLAGDLEAVQPAPDRSDEALPGESEGAGQELAACLRPMLEQLPPHYREAVTLVELEGLTQQAAARRLGLSLSGVKSRVQRGRRQLKEQLEACCTIQLDARRGVAAFAPRDGACNPCGNSQAPPLVRPTR